MARKSMESSRQTAAPAAEDVTAAFEDLDPEACNHSCLPTHKHIER